MRLKQGGFDGSVAIKLLMRFIGKLMTTECCSVFPYPVVKVHLTERSEQNRRSEQVFAHLRAKPLIAQKHPIIYSLHIKYARGTWRSRGNGAATRLVLRGNGGFSQRDGELHDVGVSGVGAAGGAVIVAHLGHPLIDGVCPAAVAAGSVLAHDLFRCR